VHRLITGEDAFRWTRVRGVVRDMYSNKSSLVLQLMDGGYGFEVVFQLEDARCRVIGLMRGRSYRPLLSVL
jgi:hypothetical protein